jgi:hypothetical protein
VAKVNILLKHEEADKLLYFLKILEEWPFVEATSKNSRSFTLFTSEGYRLGVNISYSIARSINITITLFFEEKEFLKFYTLG